MSDIVQRLKAACVGQPAKVKWPHRLLHDAIALIAELKAENASLWKNVSGLIKTAELGLARVKELEAALTAAHATESGLREVLEQIAEARDAGRHDGLPEPCPVLDADTMFAIARQALDSPSPASGTQAVVAAAREFVAKVDRGEARSRKSYAAFKAALADLDSGGTG